MNHIVIWAPRWHDRTVLIAERRLLDHNEIEITAHDPSGQLYFPQPFYLTGKLARKYPLEGIKARNGTTVAMRVVPLLELEREVIATEERHE